MAYGELSIDKVINSIPTSDGAGVKLNRVIGTNNMMSVGRFLLLDEFYSDNPDDYIAGFPNHPHRGFETFTYLIRGEMGHSDNKGNKGRLKTGSAQWMTAGRGIVHSEMPQQKNGVLRGLQLWINSPASKKMVKPRYQDINHSDIPNVKLGDAYIKVLAGSIKTEICKVTGPAKSIDETPLYMDVSLPAGKSVVIPMIYGQHAFLYILEGSVTAGAKKKTINQGQLATITKNEGGTLTVSTEVTSQFVIATSSPINEPIVRHGPFVMNSRQEIEKAIKDYQDGKF